MFEYLAYIINMHVRIYAHIQVHTSLIYFLLSLFHSLNSTFLK